MKERIDVIASKEFPLPAAPVWALLADFGNTEWLAGIFARREVEGSGPGMRRKLFQPGANLPAIHELESADPDTMVLKWSIHQTVFIPVDKIWAETRVVPLTDQSCTLVSVWSFMYRNEGVIEELKMVTEQWMLSAMVVLQDYLKKHNS